MGSALVRSVRGDWVWTLRRWDAQMEKEERLRVLLTQVLEVLV